jgi:hypothetical protein
VAIIEAYRGAAVRRKLTIRNPPDGSVVAGFTNAAALTCECWAGDDQAAVLAPSVSWINPAAGKVLFSIATGATSAVPAGLYDLVLVVVGATGTYRYPVGKLRLIPTAGTATPPPVYCEAEDVEDLAAGWVEQLRKLSTGSGLENWLRQRAEARRFVDRTVMARAKRVLEDQARRHGPLLAVDPILPSSGYDAGPQWGDSTIPDTTLRDQLAAFRGYLVAGQLMCTANGNDPQDLDDGKVARIAAHYTLYLILNGRVGMVEKTPYQALARQHKGWAIAEAIGWTALIDTNGDGKADYVLAY